MLKKKLTAIILMGGKSTRMGNLTRNKHKSLLQIGKFPILSHIFTQVRLLEVSRVIFCTGFKSDISAKYIKTFLVKDSNKILKHIKKKNLNTLPEIKISKLKSHKSTSERLFATKKLCNTNDILILYGDTILKMNFKKYLKYIHNYYHDIDCLITISNPREKFGFIEQKNNRLTQFSEKKISKNRWVNSGWIFLKNTIFSKIKKNSSSFENQLFNKHKKFKIFTFKNNNYYMPIDNISDLDKANYDWKKNKVRWF